MVIFGLGVIGDVLLLHLPFFSKHLYYSFCLFVLFFSKLFGIFSVQDHVFSSEKLEIYCSIYCFSIWIDFIYFSYINALARTSSKALNKSN